MVLFRTKLTSSSDVPLGLTSSIPISRLFNIRSSFFPALELSVINISHSSMCLNPGDVFGTVLVGRKDTEMEYPFAPKYMLIPACTIHWSPKREKLSLTDKLPFLFLHEERSQYCKKLMLGKHICQNRPTKSIVLWQLQIHLLSMHFVLFDVDLACDLLSKVLGESKVLFAASVHSSLLTRR